MANISSINGNLISDKEFASAVEGRTPLGYVGFVNATVDDGAIVASSTRLLSADFYTYNGLTIEVEDGYEWRLYDADTLGIIFANWTKSRAFTTRRHAMMHIRKSSGTSVPIDPSEMVGQFVQGDGLFSKTYGTMATTEDIAGWGQLDSTLGKTYEGFENKTFLSDRPEKGFQYSSTRVCSPAIDLMGAAIQTDGTLEFRLVNYDTFHSATGWVTTVAVAQSAVRFIQFRDASDNDADISPEDVYQHTEITSGYFDVSYVELATMGDVEDAVRVDQFSLNKPLVGKTDMIWSWWYYPQVVHFNRVRDCLYWGYTTHDGYTGVACRNLESGLITKTHLKKSDVDDHNGLSVFVDDDGTILCTYAGGHNTDTAIHVRVSKTPESIEEFGDDTPLYTDGHTSYCQLLKVASTYVMFYRVGNKTWRYRTSTNMVEWSDERIFVEAQEQYYCIFRNVTGSNLIRVCMYSNPGGTDTDIREGYLDISTDKVYDADSTEVGTTPVANTDLAVIIPQDASYATQRLYDLAVTPLDTTGCISQTLALESGASTIAAWHGWAPTR